MTYNRMTILRLKLYFMLSLMSHDKEKHLTIVLNFSNVSPRHFKNQPIMMFPNFALGYHKDIDH